MNKYFAYLDELRESGITNMWGASEFLEEDFGISPQEAQRVLLEWMRSKEKEND